ncbi:MAG: MFS transporter [Gammaproteobacteria bacterium]
MSNVSPDPSATGLKFWFVELAPGVLPRNFGTLLYSAFTTIGLLAFVSIGTPYVLNVYLKIPLAEQGQIAGDLAAWNEIAMLLIFGPCGVLADRIGRKQVFTLGFILMAVAYALYPFVSSVAELTGYRMLYAVGVGAATAALQTILADYPANTSRGKATALVGTLNGLGVVILSVGLGGLMKTFVDRGYSPEDAGYITHFIVAGLCLFSAVVVSAGLKKGTPVTKLEQLPMRELIRSGLAAARNPRIALAYASAFIARGDLVVVGTFVNLWGTSAGIEAGLDPAEASAQGRLLFAITGISGLFWLPVMGIMLDRINRVTGTTICMAIAAAGFLLVNLVDHPLAPGAWIFFALLGVGQISAFAGAATLIGQEAPPASRGAVIGMFNTFGAIGILFGTAVGGRLYDSVGPHAVFVMVGGLSLLVVGYGLWVRRTAPGPLKVGRGQFMAH